MTPTKHDKPSKSEAIRLRITIETLQEQNRSQQLLIQKQANVIADLKNQIAGKDIKIAKLEGLVKPRAS